MSDQESSAVKDPPSSSNKAPTNPDESHLPPTRVKRKYVCKKCEFTTVNPREHLRHRRDSHGEKVRIVSCDLCQYACQFKQKLTRHLNLMHRKDQTSTRRRGSSHLNVSRGEDCIDGSGTATVSHDESPIYDLFQYQPNLGKTLELYQHNYDHQLWLQMQQMVAANQHYAMANSFYSQHPVRTSEPLDLSVAKS